MRRMVCVGLASFTLALAPLAPAAASSNPVTVAAAEVEPERHGELSDTAYEGKRCRFSKGEAIVTAVFWVVGIVPGAVMTPLACKLDLF